MKNKIIAIACVIALSLLYFIVPKASAQVNAITSCEPNERSVKNIRRSNDTIEFDVCAFGIDVTPRIEYLSQVDNTFVTYSEPNSYNNRQADANWSSRYFFSFPTASQFQPIQQLNLNGEFHDIRITIYDPSNPSVPLAEGFSPATKSLSIASCGETAVDTIDTSGGGYSQVTLCQPSCPKTVIPGAPANTWCCGEDPFNDCLAYTAAGCFEISENQRCGDQHPLECSIGGNNFCCGSLDACTDMGGLRPGGQSGVDASTFDDFNPLKVSQSRAALGEDAPDLSTPGAILSRILQFAFPIAGFILFVMIFWGGFEILYGSSTSKNLEAGKKRVTTSLIGFFLLFASYWIIQILEVVFGISVLL